MLPRPNCEGLGFGKSSAANQKLRVVAEVVGVAGIGIDSPAVMLLRPHVVLALVLEEVRVVAKVARVIGIGGDGLAVKLLRTRIVLAQLL